MNVKTTKPPKQNKRIHKPKLVSWALVLPQNQWNIQKWSNGWVSTDHYSCYDFTLITMLRTLSRLSHIQSHFWGFHVNCFVLKINFANQRSPQNRSTMSKRLQPNKKKTTEASSTELSLASWYSRLLVKGAFLYIDTCGLGGWKFILMFQKAQECSKILCKIFCIRWLQNPLLEICHCDIVFFPLHGHSCSEAHVGGSRADFSETYFVFLCSQLFSLNLSVILRNLFKRLKGSVTQMGIILVLKMKVVGDNMSKCWLNSS